MPKQIQGRKKDFSSKASAESFSKKVSGNLIDLTKDPNSKCNYRVRYKATGKDHNFDNDWCPEEGRDFGYPNEYWD